MTMTDPGSAAGPRARRSLSLAGVPVHLCFVAQLRIPAASFVVPATDGCPPCVRPWIPSSEPRCPRPRMPPTVGSAADAITAGLSAIVGTGEEIKKVLQTLGKVLSNIDANPQDLKFRVLKLTNKTVARWLLPFPGAMVLLDAVGFENDGLVLSLPLDNDMPLLRQAILAADDRLRRIHVRWVSCMHPDAKTDALRLGSNGSGMALHIGRSFAADFGGGMQLGAVSSVDGKFSTTFGGQVVCSDEYEVLCCTSHSQVRIEPPMISCTERR